MKRLVYMKLKYLNGGSVSIDDFNKDKNIVIDYFKKYSDELQFNHLIPYLDKLIDNDCICEWIDIILNNVDK